jgi:outer membrane autotransporter protein
MATVFDTQIDMIESHGALMATTGGNAPLVIVADTSALAASAGALSDMTGAVSNVLDEQIDMNYAHEAQNWWLKGFGGLSQTRSSGPAVATNHIFGGAMVGADTVVGNGTQLGLFAGLSAGALNVAVDNGQRVDNQNFFAGAYGQFDADDFYLNFGLTGGLGTNNSERLIAYNLVEGGLHTANATYNSYFLSPEMTIGTEKMNVGDYGFKPSLRVRYSFARSDGYAEEVPGTSPGALTIGDRTSHIIDARLQMAMPVNTFGPDTKVELRAGLDGRLALGDNSFDATLLGTTQQFNPGGNESSVSGFVGARYSHAYTDNATIFASAELGMGTHTIIHADAEAGVKVAF